MNERIEKIDATNFWRSLGKRLKHSSCNQAREKIRDDVWFIVNCCLSAVFGAVPIASEKKTLIAWCRYLIFPHDQEFFFYFIFHRSK